ncbi:hypothetical protein ACTXT7_012885 [Hymenolepis weldensis]
MSWSRSDGKIAFYHPSCRPESATYLAEEYNVYSPPIFFGEARGYGFDAHRRKLIEQSGQPL